MKKRITGSTKSLASLQKKSLERLYQRKIPQSEVVSLDFARELVAVANSVGKQIGVLVNRQGKIEEVIIGSREILYLPDLGRYRFGSGRLRRLRLIYTDLKKIDNQLNLTADIYTDLEKLRLDLVCNVGISKNKVHATFAYVLPPKPQSTEPTRTEYVTDLGRFDFDFLSFINELEAELARHTTQTRDPGKTSAVLVGVYDKGYQYAEQSMAELVELARTAGVQVLDKVIQRRKPDPKTVLGKGKLEHVMLHCLRLGAEMLIFDLELKPGQWRAITNTVELKTIDRSMLILDIFAQRANSSEGRLQVELAQLKYNLPRLVEKDQGLSRLAGGIGGRGPGETKLEIGRRRIRERIRLLENRIDKVGAQRQLRRKNRRDNNFPVVAILGYTNVGKSTLFNFLTDSSVVAENKLFATLDPAHRRLRLPSRDKIEENQSIILTDTVGFIRHLPEELFTAFKATLEELNEASLLLHVIDASDPQVLKRKEAVEKILTEMELSDIPTICVINKSDLAESDIVNELVIETGGLAISAIKTSGIEELLEAVKQALPANTTNDLEMNEYSSPGFS